MRPLIVAVTAIGCSAAGVAVGAKPAAPSCISAQDISRWISHYYEAPAPEAIPVAIGCLSKHQMLSGESPQGVASFLGTVIAHNPGRSQQWVDELSRASEDQRFLLALALWYADLPTRDRDLAALAKTSPALRDFTDGLARDHPPDWLAIEVKDPTQLDVLWGSFFATGDPRYVERVISLLAPPDARDGLDRALLRNAARWSLGSNAAQHPRVLAICQKRLPTAAAEIRPILRELIENAEQRARDGTEAHRPAD